MDHPRPNPTKRARYLATMIESSTTKRETKEPRREEAEQREPADRPRPRNSWRGPGDTLSFALVLPSSLSRATSRRPPSPPLPPTVLPPIPQSRAIAVRCPILTREPSSIDSTVGSIHGSRIVGITWVRISQGKGAPSNRPWLARGSVSATSYSLDRSRESPMDDATLSLSLSLSTSHETNKAIPSRLSVARDRPKASPRSTESRKNERGLWGSHRR